MAYCFIMNFLIDTSNATTKKYKENPSKLVCDYVLPLFL